MFAQRSWRIMCSRGLLRSLRFQRTRCLRIAPRPLRLQGQAIMEYLLLFVAFALVSVFAVGWLRGIHGTLDQHFRIAVQRITQ